MRNLLVLLTIILLTTNAGLFAQDAENVELVGMYEHQFNMDWNSSCDIDIQNGYAYLTMSAIRSLFVYDLSTPANPRFAGSYRDSLFSCQSVSVSGDFAYLGKNRLLDGSDSIVELQVLDISSPENPTPLSSCFLDTCELLVWEESHLDVSVFGNYAYVMYNVREPRNGILKIVDISDPENLEVIWTSAQARIIQDFYISGEIAYLSTYDNENRNSQLLFLNVSNPAEPDSITVLEIEGYVSTVFIEDDLAFVFGDNLNIINISDPQNPEIIGEAENQRGFRLKNNLFVEGDFVFLVSGDWWDGGRSPERDGEMGAITAFDVSDPTEPQEIGYIETGSGLISIYVSGDWVYTTDMYGNLYVFDVSNPSEITMRNAYKSRTPSVVCVSGDYAYVAAGDAGLVILDVTDPENPVETGYINLEEMSIGQVIVEQDIVYVSTYGRVLIFCIDVSNAETPQVLSCYDTESFNNEDTNLRVSNGYVYYVDGNWLKIVAFSDPRNPEEIGEFETIPEIRNLFISNDYAYIIDSSDDLTVLDVVDPEEIILMDTCEIGWYLSDVFVAGDYAYITSNRERRFSQYEGLYTVDISNPENISLTGFLHLPSGAGSVYVSGDTACITDDEGIIIVDVSDANHPAKVGFSTTPGSSKDVFYSEDLIYVADESNLGIYRYEMEGSFLSLSSNLLDFDIFPICRSPERTLLLRNLGIEPLTVSNISTQGADFRSDFTSEIVLEPNAREEVTVTLETDEDGVSEGVLIIDSTDPRENIGRVNLTGAGIRGYYFDTPGYAKDVFISGSHAYVADGSMGLRIIDISIPENLEEIGFCDPSGLPKTVFVEGDFAYLAPTGEGFGGLSIIDVSNPENLEEVGFYDMHESMDSVIDIIVLGNYAYIATYSPVFWNCYLFVIDISDPTNPVRRGRFGPIASESDHVRISISGDICYFFNRGELILVVDISNPNRPQMINRINTLGENLDIFVSDEIAYVAVGINGLRIIDVSNPRQSELLGVFNTPESAHGVFVDRNTAYVIDGENSLLVIDVTDPANPALIDSYWTPDAKRVHVSGSYAYVVNGSDGLAMLGLSDEWGVEPNFILHPLSFILHPLPRFPQPLQLKNHNRICPAIRVAGLPEPLQPVRAEGRGAG